MPRYKLTIEYDGTDFSGWQIQPDARTIEQILEDAFSQILQQKVDLIGQGRTDAGVHARGQVAHVDLPTHTDVDKLIFGANGISGQHIHIKECEKVDDNFHARFDAISREYEYIISTRPNPLMHRYCWEINKKLDHSKLQACAELLPGEYDFAGFSKYNEDNFTTICEIQHSAFIIEKNVIRYRIRSNRFLRNMVRRIVGTMIRVAEAKLSIQEFTSLLKNPDTEIQSYTAPAKGLILDKVLYKN